ncbi:ABC transporter permease [Anaerotignum sp.]|uniref:ABC transporter permease n=1 Tax=Anaerotignum sp. TaxID=2039241 RepID=UPI0027156070|nr:ABC transporter permease [Anaerotignum sp.]
MVKGALFKKSIKDMKKSFPQFLSIFIMATVAISIATGLDSIWETIDIQSNQLYQDTNLSDLWITVTNPSETKMWQVQNISGVEKAEKQFIVNSVAQIDGYPTLKVYAMPNKNTMDVPYVNYGKKLSKGGAILDQDFADANHLTVGDKLKIEVNNKKIEFTIEALAFNSGHIFAIKDNSSLLPNPSEYGFIVVDEDRITSAYGGVKMYNQIALRLNSGVDINTIQNQVDDIFGKKLVGISTKTDNRSMKMVTGKIQQFKILAKVFPMMFFLVTTLITFSTMIRLVEEQRNQIGVLKALGYSKGSIVWHYTSYGIYVGLLGALAGFFIGPNMIGKVLISKLRFLLTLPSYDLKLNIPNFLFNSILIILCTGGVSCYSCLKLQGEMPAVLLRDKPPKRGNHIFLERFPKIWSSMKFRSKLIVRNTIKNKFRLIMSILGVMGCTGLIIGAFTLFDMVSGISKTTYEKIYTYEQKVMLEDRTSDQDIKNLNLDGIIEDVEEGMIQITADDGTRRMVGVSVFSKNSPLICLQDEDGNRVALPENGIAMTRKLAQLMNIKVGDTINLKRSDDSYIGVKVEKLVYMATGQGIYMTNSYWEKIGEDFKPTALLVKWNHIDKNFLNSDYVKSYVNKTSQKSDFEGNLNTVKSAAFMLITFGGILAFVVLYNMGILNFFERVRDLATLEVLGFRQEEIRPLVLMENFFSTGIGILFGIPVGGVITNILAKGFGDDMDLIGHITIDKVLLAAVITIVFSTIVNFTVIKKIKTIDMLQALKSVE